MMQVNMLLKELASLLGYSLSRKRNPAVKTPSEWAIKTSELNHTMIKKHISDITEMRENRKQQNDGSLNDFCKIMEKRHKSDLSRDLFLGSVVDRRRVVLKDEKLIQLDVDIAYLKQKLKEKECEILRDEVFPEVPYFDKNVSEIDTLVAEDGNLKLVLNLIDDRITQSIDKGNKSSSKKDGGSSN